MNEAVLKSKIMRRVKVTYYLKQVINPFTFKLGALIAAAFIFGSLVHVAAVFSNLSTISVVDIVGLYNFSTYAFMNTEIWVQVVMVASLLVAFGLLRDMVRKIRFGTFNLLHA
ncbi:hypothetical protein IIB51_03020 [Patescibacteria group bacterium]|nr:hypothetical protein [Patescibacteria group bacterium]MCH8050343.1 hypothetical protein [Patescibacteria group bacterium]